MPRRRGWGTGSVVPPASPAAGWAIRWQEGGRRRYKPGFPTRDLAQRALDAIRGDLARGSVGLPAEPGRLPNIDAMAKAWLDRRAPTHRATDTERARWKRELEPTFGRLTCPEVTQATIRAYVERQLAGGLSPGSVRLAVALLSSLWTDLAERPRETGATSDPTKRLPRALRRLIRSTSDPKTVPYLRELDDVGRLARALPEQYVAGYCTGALAGLRTGEVVGLAWPDVDVERRQIVVHQAVDRGQLGPTKDGEPRVVPISDSLAPVLARAGLKAGWKGLVCPPARPGRRSGPARQPARFVRPQTLGAALATALEGLGLPPLTWYQATRHTFGAHYVLTGGSLARLQAILGHSTPYVTLRYAHLDPARIGAAEVSRMAVRVVESDAAVVEIGQRTGRVARQTGGKKQRKRRK